MFKQKLAILVLLTSPAFADDLLKRAKHAFVERLESAPNYTCLLEIERTVRFRHDPGRLESRDRFRLEVSAVEGRELFTWPDDVFAERPLTDFLGQGLFSTGEFAANGRSIFTDARTAISDLPQAGEAARLTYTYKVPLEASRYMIIAAGRPVASKYEGAFEIDPDSAQVVRLEINVSDPPHASASGLTRIVTDIEYSQVKIAGEKTWLPSHAKAEVNSSAGSWANLLRFSACRSYASETSIRFSEEKEAATVATDKPQRLETIPAGLAIPLELHSNIRSETAWAGDTFEAAVYSNVRSQGAIVIPRGAQVRGRIVRIESTIKGAPSSMRKEPSFVTTISLALTEARWKGHTAKLNATLVRTERKPLMAAVDGLRSTDISRKGNAYQSSKDLSATGQGTFLLLGDVFTIRPGARMRWITD